MNSYNNTKYKLNVGYFGKLLGCLFFLFLIEFGNAHSNLGNINNKTGATNVNALANIPNTSVKNLPVYKDFLYQLRLATIQSEIPLSYNNHVKNWIEVYTIRKRELTKKVLGLSKIYYPLFDKIFAKYNLPSELKHLAIIESAINPYAVSRKGATGIWQFMYWTGKAYDLEVNYYIDDRKNPYKATEAAAQYLSSLYKKYNNWLLVIAAYNCGPGNVNKAIRRAGNKKDFWEIRKYLPRETRSYVPAFIAVNYIMNYKKEHGLYSIAPKEYNKPINDDHIGTVSISQVLLFSTLANYIGMSTEEIAILNPSYKKHIVPSIYGPKELKLPLDKIDIFNTKKDSIFLKTKETPSSKKIIYKVKYGDNLYHIAKKYNCMINDIIQWNYLKTDKIFVNQKLILYFSKNRHTSIQPKKHNKINTVAITANKRTIINNTKTAYNNKTNKFIYYTINPGDTLWNIAQRYPGVTVETLKKVNQITDERKIKTGSVIKIQFTG